MGDNARRPLQPDLILAKVRSFLRRDSSSPRSVRQRPHSRDRKGTVPQSRRQPTYPHYSSFAASHLRYTSRTQIHGRVFRSHDQTPKGENRTPEEPQSIVCIACPSITI